MHDVVYDLSTSLDGYTVDDHGGIDWSVPDDDLFRLALDEVRRVGVHLLGRIATDDLATEIARLKEEPGDGDIAIGGSTLATTAADLGLIDEYRIRAYPVLLGAGVPYFPHHGVRQSLELVECRRIGPVAYLRYRVSR